MWDTHVGQYRPYAEETQSSATTPVGTRFQPARANLDMSPPAFDLQTEDAPAATRIQARWRTHAAIKARGGVVQVEKRSDEFGVRWYAPSSCTNSELSSRYWWLHPSARIVSRTDPIPRALSFPPEFLDRTTRKYRWLGPREPQPSACGRAALLTSWKWAYPKVAEASREKLHMENKSVKSKRMKECRRQCFDMLVELDANSTVGDGEQSLKQLMQEIPGLWECGVEPDELLATYRSDHYGNVVAFETKRLAGRDAITSFDPDHIFPWSRGGRSEPDNFMALYSGANQHVKNDEIVGMGFPEDLVARLECGMTIELFVSLWTFFATFGKQVSEASREKQCQGLREQIEWLLKGPFVCTKGGGVPWDFARHMRDVCKRCGVVPGPSTRAEVGALVFEELSRGAQGALRDVTKLPRREQESICVAVQTEDLAAGGAVRNTEQLD